jgi:hypothetical protein
LVAALLPITEGAMWGWTSWREATLLAGALVLLTVWLATELRRARPLVQLSAIALPGVAGGSLLFLVTGATVAVINLTVPALLEAPAAAGYGAGASVLTAGLDLLPFALAIMAAGFLVGRLARQLRPRDIAVATLACEAIALVLLAAFHRQGDQVALLVAFFGLGHGGSLAVEYVLLTREVPAAAAGGVTGVATAVSGISGAAASAVTTALLASRLARAGATTLPAVAGYDHAWLFAAAVAAAGATAAAASAFADRNRDGPGDEGVTSRGESARSRSLCRRCRPQAARTSSGSPAPPLPSSGRTPRPPRGLWRRRRTSGCAVRPLPRVHCCRSSR